jgi:nitronate monooxygenase
VNNPLRTLLGIDHPIIQAPMAGVQGSSLAIAVCNAGGLDSLPCAMLGPAEMRAELTALRAKTDQPFNVNFFCHSQPEPDAAREAAWRSLLAPDCQRKLGRKRFFAAVVRSKSRRLP